MTTLPPCVGRSDLFDSCDRADHLVAREFCRSCDHLTACRTELRAVQKTEAGAGITGGPQGTWAGLLVGRPTRGIPGLPREVREARAAYVRGDRTAWAVAGNRAYERARSASRREAS